MKKLLPADLEYEGAFDVIDDLGGQVGRHVVAGLRFLDDGKVLGVVGRFFHSTSERVGVEEVCGEFQVEEWEMGCSSVTVKKRSYLPLQWDGIQARAEQGSPSLEVF